MSDLPWDSGHGPPHLPEGTDIICGVQCQSVHNLHLPLFVLLSCMLFCLQAQYTLTLSKFTILFADHSSTHCLFASRPSGACYNLSILAGTSGRILIRFSSQPRSERELCRCGHFMPKPIIGVDSRPSGPLTGCQPFFLVFSLLW